MVLRSLFAITVLTIVATSGAAAQETCDAPQPVCDVRDAVFVVEAFEPFASAVRISDSLLVTNRHVVADLDIVAIRLADGTTVEGRTVPTSYEGDLALIASEALGEGPVLTTIVDADEASDLYTVAGDEASGLVAVYEPGRLLLPPAEAAPRPRLHHSAHQQWGNSGGALVDAEGRLVGIVASGGEGRYEAMPAADIALVRSLSGPAADAADEELGSATRDCVENLERWTPSRAQTHAEELASVCTETANRQLMDLAAQALGRSRLFDEAAELLVLALERDPHALNTRIALLVTLQFQMKHEEQLPHFAFLFEHLPDDPFLLRMAVQAGVFGGHEQLLDEALFLIEQYRPELIDWAERLVDAGGQ